MAAEDLNVAAELALLRGLMDTGFATLQGSLNLIAQSHGQTTEELRSLDARVTSLEARRIPMGALTVVSGVVSAVIATGAFLVQL